MRRVLPYYGRIRDPFITLTNVPDPVYLGPVGTSDSFQNSGRKNVFVYIGRHVLFYVKFGQIYRNVLSLPTFSAICQRNPADCYFQSVQSERRRDGKLFGQVNRIRFLCTVSSVLFCLQRQFHMCKTNMFRLIIAFLLFRN